MNKTEAMSYGVREDAYRDFQEHYNKDARKMAAKMAAEDKGRETAPSAPFPDALRRAIVSMLQVIPDVNRLSLILSTVNRHYQQYQNELHGVGAKASQKAQETSAEDNAQKPPEIVQEGACECP